MKNKSLFALLCISTLVVAQAPSASTAVSIGGKWALHSTIAGNESDGECTFTQTGNNLTGSCGGAEQPSSQLTGTVDGNKVSWSTKGEYNGTALTMKYTAVVTDGKMKGELSIDPFGVSGDFTATPAAK